MPPTSRIRSLLLFIFAIGLAFAAPTFAAPLDTADDTADDTAYVFAGKVDPQGGWTELHFDGLPNKLDALSPTAALAIHVECTDAITARAGTRMRVAASPRAAEIGRIKRGEAVTCVEIVVRYGIVWARVQRPVTHAKASESTVDDIFIMHVPVEPGCAPGDKPALAVS